MEHEYIVPSIEDLQIYYDLVWYVTEIIQAKLLVISAHTEISYIVCYNNKEHYCDIKYQYKDCGFIIEIRDFTKTETKDEQVNIEIYLRNKNDEDDFIQAFRFYLSTLTFEGFFDLDKYKADIGEIKQNNVNK